MSEDTIDINQQVGFLSSTKTLIHGTSTAVARLFPSCFSAWQPSQPLRPPPQQQTGSPAEAPSGLDTRRATPGTQHGAMPPVIDRNTDVKIKGTS